MLNQIDIAFVAVLLNAPPQYVFGILLSARTAYIKDNMEISAGEGGVKIFK